MLASGGADQWKRKHRVSRRPAPRGRILRGRGGVFVIRGKRQLHIEKRQALPEHVPIRVRPDDEVLVADRNEPRVAHQPPRNRPAPSVGRDYCLSTNRKCFMTRLDMVIST